MDTKFSPQPIILHSTSLTELRAIIGEVFREELRQFNTANQIPPKFSGEYHSRHEVCELLKISTTTLYYWTKNGTLQGYRIGGRVLYKTVEVEAALSEIANFKGKHQPRVIK